MHRAIILDVRSLLLNFKEILNNQVDTYDRLTAGSQTREFDDWKGTPFAMDLQNALLRHGGYLDAFGYKPVVESHSVNSYEDIIDNSIVATSDQMYNHVEVLYGDNADATNSLTNVKYKTQAYISYDQDPDYLRTYQSYQKNINPNSWYDMTEADSHVEAMTAGGPDANYLGVVDAPATSATAQGVITLTSEVAATNALIKPGQVILIGADDDSIDTGLDSMDTSAGHFDPIYQGPNKQYLEVVSISGTTLTVKAVGKATLTNLANIDTDNTIYFLDPFHAAGGTTTEGVTFPKGLTIYGRWTKVTPAADADGGLICYFGK